MVKFCGDSEEFELELGRYKTIMWDVKGTNVRLKGTSRVKTVYSYSFSTFGE